LLGASMQINLAYWFFLLPIFLIGSFSYIAINIAKANAIRRIAVARMASASDVEPIDRLMFANHPTAFSTYPSRIGFAFWTLAMLGLSVNVAVAISYALTADVWFVGSDSLRQLIVFTFYASMFTRAVCRRIRNEAVAISGEAAKPRNRWPRLRKMRDRSRNFVARTWRTFVWSGSGLTFWSLFLSTAGATQQCNGRRHTGRELFTGDADAKWPVQFDDFVKPVLRFDSLGRYVYITSIVIAVVAFLLAILTLLPAFARLAARFEVWTALRAFVIPIFFFVLCEFGFVYSVISLGFAAQLPPLWELVYWVIPSSLYLWMRVLRRQRHETTWRSRVRPFLLILYAPALLTAPAATILCALVFADNFMWGVPAYAGGVLLLAAGVTLMPVPQPATEPSAQLLESPLPASAG